MLELHGCLRMQEVQDAFVRYANRLVPAQAHGIYELDADTGALSVQTRGVNDEFLAEYEAVGRQIDPVFAGVATRHDPVSSDLFWDDDAWRAEPIYDVLGRGDIHHLLQAPLVVEGRLVGTLNVASPRAAPAFGHDETDRLRFIARHVSVAYARAQRVETLERRCTITDDLLDVLNVPLLAHTRDGTIFFANRAADRLLAVHLDERGAAALRSALRRNATALADGTRRVVSESFTLPTRGDVGEWQPRLRRPQGRCTALAVRTTALPHVADAVVSFVYALPTVLATPLPGLSTREQEVVELVVRGLSNRAIAEAASISENTVKQHLKRVYAKLDVHSRAELAAEAAWATADPDSPFTSA